MTPGESMKRLAVLVILVALGAGGIAGCGGGSETGLGDIHALLPTEGAVPGLRAAGDPDVFGKDELYRYVDGGADSYLELGFDRLIVQRYERGDAELELEIYVMKSAAAASAAYRRSDGRENHSPEIGDRNTLNPYQLQLVRDNVYFVVNNPSGNEGLVPAMIGLARAAADRIASATTSDPRSS